LAFTGPGHVPAGDPETEPARNHGLSRSRLKEIVGIIEAHYEDIKDAWQERLG